MGTVNIDLAEDLQLNLPLGQQLENAVTEVVFDFSAWQTTYGSGTLALSVQRPGDDMPYAVTMTTSGTNATWSVTNLDTAYKGVGHIQLTYTVGTAIKKSVVYKFTVYESLGANGEYPSPGQTWQQNIEAEIGTLSNLPTTDKSSLVASINEIDGDITDVKQDLQDLQEEIEGGGSGLTADLKAALDQLAQKVAYIDADGQDYYDALHAALYPPANLTSISCVYTQSGTVYDTDSLDSLKSDLVVTAHYDNSTSQVVTTYILSGTLAEGTSTITVSYGGKTTTFTVTVTAVPSYVTSGLIHQWDGINNTGNGDDSHSSTSTTWKDLVGSINLSGTFDKATWASNGLTFNTPTTRTDRWRNNTLPSIDGACTIEMAVTINSAITAGIGCFGPSRESYSSSDPLRKISIFADNTLAGTGNSGLSYTNPEASLTDIHNISCVYDSTPAVTSIQVNGQETSLSSQTHSFAYAQNVTFIGLADGQGSNMYGFDGTIHAIRIYNRALTDAERSNNYAMDRQRFGW